MGLGKKTILGIAMKDVRDAGFSLKRRGKCRLGSISMSLGFWEWGCPYAYHCDCTRKCMLFLSPVSSRFVVVLVLFQFRGPDYLRAWNRLVSMTSTPGITLSRAYSFIGRLVPKILFSIMRLFITAFLQSHTHEYLLRTVVELNTAWESKLLSKTKPIQWK